MHRDDAQLISRTLAGDTSACRTLFERYVPAVEEVLARARVLETAEQSDLVEESFLHAFSNLARLREPNRFAAYLLGIAHGMARQRCAIASGSEAHFCEKPNFDVSSLQSPGTRLELELCLREALATLPPETRQIAEASCFDRQERPQALATRLSLDVAQVGAHLQIAEVRFKVFLLARLLADQPGLPGDLDAAANANADATAPWTPHLTTELYEAILRGEPVDHADRLSAHLRAGCPDCEALLCHRPSTDALDGVLAAILFAQSRPKRGRHRDLAMFQRILRRLKIGARLNGELPGLSTVLGNRRDVIPLIAAGLLGLAGLTLFALRATPSFQATLDESAQRDLELAFHLAEPPALGDEASDGDGDGDSEDDALAPIEGIPGQSTPSSRQLLLSYRLLRSRFVAITRIRPDDSLELLELPGRRSPGKHHLSIKGVPARLLLRDAVGRNRFAVLASERPIDAAELKSIKAFLQSEGTGTSDAGLPQGMTAEWFDLVVTPDR
ncbi:MAG: sigma-70 family RNA polymerase sigma factor [Myxococcales bacterium]|jgi:DNA-directed RNA polymerase specialized sigma24 family protein|nr:sigma-70 family RNA polymerase sigma factor [Myxococcales bacterium]